jgi:hypothetical protein
MRLTSMSTLGEYCGEAGVVPQFGMSYVLPPNNNIGKIVDQNLTDDDRRRIVAPDLELQLESINNTPEGNGAVRGWGGRGLRR